MRLPVDAPDSRELAAATLASSIVGEGETCHLHRRLVRRDKTALSAGMGVNALIAGNSLGLGSVRAVPGQDLDRVVDAVADVLQKFAADGPTDTELALARAQAERDWLDEMGTAAGRADALSACTLLFDDPEVLNERLSLLRSITAEEVQMAAQSWLLRLSTRRCASIPSGQESRYDAHRDSASRVAGYGMEVCGVPRRPSGQRLAGARLRLPRTVRHCGVAALRRAADRRAPRRRRRGDVDRSLSYPRCCCPVGRGVRGRARSLRGRS
ncbi:MAG: hypothetical protein WKF73_03330 [Nocardioidaceae bacterium]